MLKLDSLINGSFKYTSVGVFNIFQVLFSYCYNKESGGAVFLDCIEAKICIFSSSFDFCISEVYAGGVFSDKCKELLYNACCFFRCNSSFGFSFNGFSHSASKITQMNRKDEYSIAVCNAASLISGTQTCLWHESNSSYSRCFTYSAGIRMRFNSSGVIGSYSQVCYSSGPCITGFDITINNVNPECKYMNWINCSSTSGWFEYFYKNICIRLSNCIFHKLSSMPVIKYSHGATGTIILANCIVESPYSSSFFSNVITQSCTFSYQTYSRNSINLLNTIECWTSSSNMITLIKQMCVPHFNILFFNILSLVLLY